MESQLSHSPYFWVDMIGLIAQAGALWFAASRLPKSDWLFGVCFVITSALSLFSAFWPIFDPKDAELVRYSLHVTTACSFVAVAILIRRDYRERAGAGSLDFNWKVIVSGFLALMLVVWMVIPFFLSVTSYLGRRTQGQLTDIQKKAATAAGVGKTTANLAEQNKEINLINSDKIDRLEAKVDKLIVVVADVPGLRDEVWGLKMEVRKLRSENAQKSSIIYLPDRLQHR